MPETMRVGGSTWTFTKGASRVSRGSGVWYRDYTATADDREPVILRFPDLSQPSLPVLADALGARLKIPALDGRILFVPQFGQEGVLRVESNELRRPEQGIYAARLSLTLTDGRRRECQMEYSREQFATDAGIAAALRAIAYRCGDDAVEPFHLQAPGA